MLGNCFGIRRQFTIYQMITRHSNYTLECTPPITTTSVSHRGPPPITHNLQPTFHEHGIRMYQHFLASASLHIQLAVQALGENDGYLSAFKGILKEFISRIY